MLHPKSIGSTSVLNAWRFVSQVSQRQLSRYLTQEHKLSTREQKELSGRSVLHYPRSSPGRNGRPVRVRVLERPSPESQEQIDTRERSASAIPCRSYRGTRRHKLLTNFPSELEALRKWLVKARSDQREIANQEQLSSFVAQQWELFNQRIRDAEASSQSSKESHSHLDDLELSSQAPVRASTTQSWYDRFFRIVIAIPKHVSKLEFPAGDIKPVKHSTGPMPKRTQEDRRRAEAVLTTPVFLLANYITPEMLESIKESPHYDDMGAVVIRCDHHQKQAGNKIQCFRLLTRLLKSIAMEINYREQADRKKKKDSL